VLFGYGSGISVPIDDSSQIGEARRAAAGAAAVAGLNEVEAGRLAIITAEAATNISKHAKRGEIVLRAIGESRAVDLIAIDAGPGIRNLEQALRDGYSTAGSPGTGLGAIARLASSFDIFTAPEAGTVISARVEAGQPLGPRSRSAFEVGVVRAAKRGETECGDDWGMVVDEGRGRALLTVADGLGHGTSAAEASRRAVELAAESSTERPSYVVAGLHRGLRSTRGAAVAVAELDANSSDVRYAGLGNISGAIVGPADSKSLMSHNGIAGHEMRKIQEISYIWPADALLVMHSDGVSAKWDLSRYPGLFSRHPSVVAGVIYRDFSRGRDDAVVVVVRRST